MVDNDCLDTETHKVEKKCKNVELRGNQCLERKIIGEAYEFCRDPGRTLYNHKCLATKPSINGGCLNGDIKISDGRCINQNDIKEKVDGYYCKGKDDRLDGNKCIIYDIVEAKYN